MHSIKPRRLALALAVLAAAFTVVGVSPAAGSGGSFDQTIGCEWTTGADTFSSLAKLGSAHAARGTKHREPVLRGGRGDDGAADKEKVTNFSATIPVYFHVLRSGPTENEGNVTDTQIQQQIDVLNATFAGARGGVDTKFRFFLAGVDRTTNAEWFAMEPESAEEVEAKTALHRGGLNALNIYSTNGANDFFLGWAYFPKDGKRFVPIDGIVVHFESMPGGDITFFNLGFTATHEAGHWLGLWHTFDFGCQGQGDKVKDTPQMSVPTSGCPPGKDTCLKDPGLDPIHNYMDYSIDDCYTEFTAGQAERMQKQFSHYRG
jgi:Pregnancy-associated plasma protein-A